jgi:hypothetical protein
MVGAAGKERRALLAGCARRLPAGGRIPCAQRKRSPTGGTPAVGASPFSRTSL